MSTVSASTHDPRSALVRDKYFSLHPKPLERWLWQQGLPQAAERVFWLHWEEGMKAGDWCSQIPLKRVAAECCIDPSTVTRAYQLLKSLGLIRRQDPGRDPGNPFQQATAVTEVRVPRELLVELGRSPNRPRRGEGERQAPAADRQPVAAPASRPVASAPDAAPRGPALSREASAALFRKLSAAERQAFFRASQQHATAMPFDATTTLTPEERAQLLDQLTAMASIRPTPAAAPSSPVVRTAVYSKPRRLAALDAARVRKRVLELVPGSGAGETLRQVLWAVEEGALRRFELPLAVNIALKKIREGAWTRPNRMPPNWMRLLAGPETCTAA